MSARTTPPSAPTTFAQMRDSVANIIKEKSALVSYYPLLKKATTSTGPPGVPGYVFVELVELSFSSPAAAAQLAEYLTSRLARPSTAKAKVKTLKSTDAVARKGSRMFRKRLRQLDEVLRSAANVTVTEDLLEGASATLEIRDLAKGIRVYIFDDEIVQQDESTEPEVPPKRLSTLSGLGSSSKPLGASGGGKYDGFGNSPISKENLGDKVLDMVESALSPLDGRSEVMEMCLQSSTGEYQAIEIAAADSGAMNQWEAGPTVSKGRVKAAPKRHTPGKAGGGWEDDDEAEEEQEQLLQLKRVAELSVHSSSLGDEDDDSAGERSKHRQLEENVKESEEHKLVRGFCDSTGMPKLCEVRQTFQRCCGLNCVNVVFLLGQELNNDTSTTDQLMRAMLLLEPFLRSDIVKMEVISKTTLDSLEKIGNSSEEKRLATKAKKLSLIIAALARTR